MFGSMPFQFGVSEVTEQRLLWKNETRLRRSDGRTDYADIEVKSQLKEG